MGDDVPQVDPNKKWTEEERLELAAKLDAELDDFINGLEKKRYAEGWPEDRWQEEMDKHPFFMKKAPQPGDEVHPMFEGLQKLKYDPEENTKEELALNYKEDGNFYMKHKKFRMAVYSFSEAIKAGCDKPDVQAILYNNRSAAHYFLKNYRTSLGDAQKALEYKPDYVKARWRAAQCAYELEKFDVCTQLCTDLLKAQPDHAAARQLLQRNKSKKLESERDLRKSKAEAQKRLTRFHRLCDALQKREIKFDDLPKGKSISEELLRPKFLPLEDHPVHLDVEDSETLVWPVAFSEPEILRSDFMQQVPEYAVMEELLESLYPNVSNKTVYYENRKGGCVHKVDIKKTISEIVKEKGFFVTGGSLLFYVVPTGSPVEQEFLHQPRRPWFKEFKTNETQ